MTEANADPTETASTHLSKPPAPRPGWTYTVGGWWLPRLTPAEREARNARIRELYDQSWSQTAIAAELGCTQPTVSKVLRQARKAEAA